MRVVHFTLGRVNPDSSNGINRVIEGLSKYGNQLENVEVDVICYKANQKKQRMLYQRDGFNVLAFNSFYRVMEYFKKNAGNIDLVHLHNTWSFYNVILSMLLAKRSIPYIVTAHAGLMEDRVKGSNYFLKIMFQFFFQKRHFDRAHALQAIAREEMTNIFEYTKNNNIFFIPNGIDTESIVLPKKRKRNDKINIGYLGRLSEEKNILGLIRALTKLDTNILSRIRLVIMGPINNSYAQKCISLVESLSLENHVVFLGKIYSKDKWIGLSNLDIFIQVSYSEGASLTILEAMFSKLPLIISRTCNISYLNGHDFLKMVEPIPSDISRGITEAVSDIDDFRRTGLKSHDFVTNNYEWKIIASSMIQIYEKALVKK